jgi:uridine kinase
LRGIERYGRELAIDDVSATLTRHIIDRLHPHGEHMDVVITGGAAIGKTTLAGQLAKDIAMHLGGDDVVSVVSLDGFMLDRSTRDALGLSGYDISAYMFDEMRDAVTKLCEGQKVQVQSYSHMTGRHDATQTIGGGRIVIYEGAVAFKVPLCKGQRFSVMITANVISAALLRVLDEITVRRYSWRRILRLLLPEIRAYKHNVVPMAGRADVVVRTTIGRRYRLPVRFNI